MPWGTIGMVVVALVVLGAVVGLATRVGKAERDAAHEEAGRENAEEIARRRGKAPPSMGSLRDWARRRRRR